MDLGETVFPDDGFSNTVLDLPHASASQSASGKNLWLIHGWAKEMLAEGGRSDS